MPAPFVLDFYVFMTCSKAVSSEKASKHAPERKRPVSLASHIYTVDEPTRFWLDRTIWSHLILLTTILSPIENLNSYFLRPANLHEMFKQSVYTLAPFTIHVGLGTANLWDRVANGRWHSGCEARVMAGGMAEGKGVVCKLVVNINNIKLLTSQEQ